MDIPVLSNATIRRIFLAALPLVLFAWGSYHPIFLGSTIPIPVQTLLMVATALPSTTSYMRLLITIFYPTLPEAITWKSALPYAVFLYALMFLSRIFWPT
jgi:hypothetical protein